MYIATYFGNIQIIHSLMFDKVNLYHTKGSFLHFFEIQNV